MATQHRRVILAYIVVAVLAILGMSVAASAAHSAPHAQIVTVGLR
jgi:hypothetical protein